MNKDEVFKKLEDANFNKINANEINNGKEESSESLFKKIYYNLDSLKNAILYLREEIDYINNRLSDHFNNGHLPAIKSTEQMTRAIDSLGLSEEYSVEKRVLYATKNNFRGKKSLLIKNIK